MSSQICTVSAATLKGLLLVAGNEDVRYYLNGIYFDPANGRLVATDGSALILVNQKFDEKCEPFILPRETLDMALKLASKSAPDLAILCDTPKHFAIAGVNGTTTCLEIDGKFPEYLRVIPQSVSNDPAQFDPEILARVQKGFKLISGGSRHFVVHHNGAGASVITAGDIALAVIMSWREDDDLPAALKAHNIQTVQS